MEFLIFWKHDIQDGCSICLKSEENVAGTVDLEVLENNILITCFDFKIKDLDTDTNIKQIFSKIIEDLKNMNYNKLYFELEHEAFSKPMKWHKELGFEEDNSITELIFKNMKVSTDFGDQYIAIKL